MPKVKHFESSFNPLTTTSKWNAELFFLLKQFRFHFKRLSWIAANSAKMAFAQALEILTNLP